MVMRSFQERKLANRLLYSWPVFFLAGALVAVSFWGVLRNTLTYMEIRREVVSEEGKLADYEGSKRRFEEQLSALDTPEGLEKEARARFNLKKPGERVAVFLDSDIPAKSSGLRAQIASVWDGIKNYFYSPR